MARMCLGHPYSCRVTSIILRNALVWMINHMENFIKDTFTEEGMLSPAAWQHGSSGIRETGR